MDYHKFKNTFLHLPIILSRDVELLEINRQILRNQLRRWQKRGLIIRLKKGMYILNANDRKINPSKQFLANQLYSPSYVSLEYALNFYGFIPERVLDVTSVTTKKTACFKNDFGNFIYQHIKTEAFRGFGAIKDESNLTYFMAGPEKAIVDFLYLNLNKFDLNDIDIFESSYRFQNLEDLSQRKILEMAKIFSNPKLTKVARLFCEFIKKEAK